MKGLDKVLRELDKIIENNYFDRDLDMYYADYRRRVELLTAIIKYTPADVKSNVKIVDAGCAPGFTSIALKLLGYDVTCLDLDPDPYRKIFDTYGVKVLKVDLEHDKIPLDSNNTNIVIFTEVLEHLNPYYISWTLSEINRILKYKGLLFLSTPNIASIGKRVKLILGKQPLGRFHVKEYTMDEVAELLSQHGFKVISQRYSMAYDLTPYHAKHKDFLLSLIKAVIKYSTKENIFKLIVLPLVKTLPSLRATIFIVAEKISPVRPQIINRRF